MRYHWLWLVAIVVGVVCGLLLPSHSDLAVNRIHIQHSEMTAPLCQPIENGDVLVWNQYKACWDGVSIGSLTNH